jgi:hypothetical protein
MTQSIPPFPPSDDPSGLELDYSQTKPTPRTSGAAVASLVLGSLGCIPLITGLLAIAFGIVGIRKTKTPLVAGRGMAIAGLILGIISVMGWAGLGGMLGIGYVESKPAAAVAKQFLHDLGAGNIAAATTNSVGFAPGALQTQAAQLAAFGALVSVSLTSFNYSIMNGRANMSLGGTATYTSGTKTCSFGLVKVGGVYKVLSYRVQ